MHWLEAPSARLSGRDPDRHPRPLLPRQRDRAGFSSSTAASGIPYEGNYFVLAQAEAEAPRTGRTRRRSPPAHARARARVDRRPRRRRARPSPRRAIERYDELLKTPAKRPARPRRSSFRWRNASARTSSSSRRLNKGFGDNLLIDDLDLQAAARRHCRRHRARTAPARPRCSA